MRANGAMPPALCLIESATPLEVEADLGLALAFARDPPEPFELVDRALREPELDRRALDFVFVWGTMTFLSPPGSPRKAAP